MNGLSLFSGIGGIDVALSGYVRPVAYCEIDSYCQGVLFSRMARGEMEIAPIWDDIRTFPTSEFTKRDIDIIFGGFPCQDISIAGHGRGLEGERSGLFFEIVRLAKEIKPRFIFLENVPAITHRGGLRVVREIASLGYDCRWCVISAASVGALHRRERWFLLAYSQSEQNRGLCKSRLQSDTRNSSENVCDTMRKPSEQTNQGTEPEQTEGRAWRGHTRQCWPFESVEHWKKTVSEMGPFSAAHAPRPTLRAAARTAPARTSSSRRAHRAPAGPTRHGGG